MEPRSSLVTVPNFFTAKVSSVLNRDAKQFGKRHLFDADEETCWNSDQGTPQFVVVEFAAPTEVAEVRLRFQGGFVGRDCRLEAVKVDGSDYEPLLDFYPEDTGKLQCFEIDKTRRVSASKYRIFFGSSTDFFGRITMYSLDLLL